MPDDYEDEERTQLWDPLEEEESEIKAIQLISGDDDTLNTTQEHLPFDVSEEYFPEDAVPPLPPPPDTAPRVLQPDEAEEMTVLTSLETLAAIQAEVEAARRRQEDQALAAAVEEWRGLHPASLWINLLPQTWRTLRGLWPVLLLIVVGGQQGGSTGADLALIGTFFAISISRTVVHFLTLRYRLSAGKLEVRSGLISRRSRVLDPYRIQNIELVRNPFHKLAGLVELRVETAGDASTAGLLSALYETEAERLKDALERLARLRQRGDSADTDATEQVGREILALSPAELVAFGLSKRTVGTVALLLAVGMEALSYLDPGQAEEVTRTLSSVRAAGLVLLAFAGTWVFSAGQALVQHHAFRLLVRGDRLVTEEGLLTRRSVEIPRSKVQVVRVDEPWLRRQMGFGTAYLETAALGMADGEVRQAEGVVPMVPQDQLGRLVAEAAPVAETDPWAVALRPAHPRALYRAVLGSLIQALLLGGLAAWLLPWPWGLAALAILLPLGALTAWLDWKKQGWLVTPQLVIARQGFLTRRTWIVARNKIQSVHLGQGPVMRWHGLGQIRIYVAGSQVALPDVGIEVAAELLETLRQTWAESEPATGGAPGHAG